MCPRCILNMLCFEIWVLPQIIMSIHKYSKIKKISGDPLPVFCHCDKIPKIHILEEQSFILAQSIRRLDHVSLGPWRHSTSWLSDTVRKAAHPTAAKNQGCSAGFGIPSQCTPSVIQILKAPSPPVSAMGLETKPLAFWRTFRMQTITQQLRSPKK